MKLWKNEKFTLTFRHFSTKNMWNQNTVWKTTNLLLHLTIFYENYVKSVWIKEKFTHVYLFYHKNLLKSTCYVEKREIYSHMFHRKNYLKSKHSVENYRFACMFHLFEEKLRTVWTFQKFPATQIFREINFRDFSGPKLLF